MSLISEALRKARQETAEREARERGLETPVVAGYWKRGGRLGVGLVLGAAIALGAAVIGGALVWWALADRSEPNEVEAPDERVQADLEVMDDLPNPSNGVPEPDQSDLIVPTVTPAESKVDEPDVSPIIEGIALTRVEVVESAPDSEEGVPVKVPSPQPPLADGEFVEEAHVGEVTLTLDYLVFRKENPFAMINGRDVRVGAVVEDYVVEAITENSVVLTQGDTRIVLRVQ